MRSEDTLIDGARKRFTETDSAVLSELWATDGRTDWAESALRAELITRGADPGELDLIASRREEIAANAPPSSRELIWNYGVGGRVMTIGAIFLWWVIERLVLGLDVVFWIGATAIAAVYAYVLTRRTSLQAQHSTGDMFGFVGGYQLLLAWGFVVIGVIGSFTSISD